LDDELDMFTPLIMAGKITEQQQDAGAGPSRGRYENGLSFACRQLAEAGFGFSGCAAAKVRVAVIVHSNHGFGIEGRRNFSRGKGRHVSSPVSNAVILDGKFTGGALVF
jgi:hypothetical protein